MQRSRIIVILTAVIALAVGGMAARPYPSSPGSIGFVDMPAVLEQVPGYPEAQRAFESELDGYQRELDGLEAQIDSMIARFERQEGGLSASQRRERAESIRALQRQLQTRAQQFDERAREREAELLGPLHDRVQEVIDSVRADQKLAAIFDVSAEGSTILSADPALHVTDAVVARVRRGDRR